MNSIYENILQDISNRKQLLAVLIDPETFQIENGSLFLKSLPQQVTHLFVGGSTSENNKTSDTIQCLKKCSKLPLILFPGDAKQITSTANAILFLSLLSGRNPEYLIEQHLKAVPILKNTHIEIIPTGYILIDGGKESAVERVSKTKPIAQNQIKKIINTALAGQYLGKKLIYLEAGSGALHRVNNKIISEVKKAVQIPLLVGGGITSAKELQEVFNAGADMVVIGTAFETQTFEM
ncbi:MAG: geranylgeranylglyceryl/heptaprenylglyceryl phosphate synthase [Flavobacteriaceae bacterium CG_4_8_14_3_um_filter_34_10]|nr:geranylgeranylglyceryl/heptaprenylglyceryl phosphate synthase [Flavobacteriia bacterium]OIP51279.1 MAG: geranylgeranylglyceryl/heptaprenylglyceryl phosphate synthase [Flavobacteriaceae bacterium CG2_30_34_30]PIQ18685.1 MAG: geranylgeranylglyceryl/heptaprenylglyceryl phosphate synthase [Flavobacteriaceae bacterium CG18_big_fil_WC_8_21_14_2_50_34_36]PIV48765.1 MAG: geranylgeranylglyceryl/heptaprenylglyceryl phosphate synthase [Flavobacteriaceae bacterium CG02_land_8_20_14_3_00_34_13]PIX09400.1